MKKSVILLCILLCAIVMFGVHLAADHPEEDIMEADEPLIQVLDTNLDFTEKSPYEYAEGNGKIHAVCNPEYAGSKLQKVVVTVSNHSGKKAEWKNNEDFRLEKKLDGEWYYQPKYEPYKNDVYRILDDDVSNKYEYKIDTSAEKGTYRLLFLFVGNWCSAEFEII